MSKSQENPIYKFRRRKRLRRLYVLDSFGVCLDLLLVIWLYLHGPWYGKAVASIGPVLLFLILWSFNFFRSKDEIIDDSYNNI